jgi:hypothetical protein
MSHDGDDRSIDAIDGQLHQNDGEAGRTSLTSVRLMTDSNPVHALIASSRSVGCNRTYLGSIESLLGPTPAPPDTCHPSGEAPVALPCSVGGNLGRSPC